MDNILYLDSGTSLADIIKWAESRGVTDYSSVTIEMNSETMCSGHEVGEYCYCPIGYRDVRIEVRKPTCKKA